MSNPNLIIGDFFPVWKESMHGNGMVEVCARLLSTFTTDNIPRAAFLLGEMTYLLVDVLPVKGDEGNCSLRVVSELTIGETITRTNIAEVWKIDESFLLDGGTEFIGSKLLAKHETSARLYLRTRKKEQEEIEAKLAKSLCQFGGTQTAASFGVPNCFVVFEEEGDVIVVDSFQKPIACKSLDCAIAVILSRWY